MTNYDLDKIEQMIRTGNITKARKKLWDIPVKSISTRNLAKAANLFRRVGDPSKGITILKGQIYPEFSNMAPAKPIEIYEYAMCLNRIGATTESEILLNKIENLSDFPHAFLQRGFQYMRDWNYTEAIKSFSKFLEGNLSNYDRLIGQLNLGASHIAARNPIGEKIIHKILASPNIKNFKLLKVICFELLGQAAVLNNVKTEASIYIEQARNVLNDKKHKMNYTIEKWSILADSELDKEETIKKLKDLSKKAMGAGEWEVRRDSDFWIAKLSGNTKLLKVLYFGSPSKFYRQRILDVLKDAPDDTLLWSPGNSSENIETVLDLSSTETPESLSKGKNIHRLLICLSQDFYRPAHIGSIHSALFENEKYDPVYSYQKILQLVCRTRKWLSSNHPGLKIVKTGGGYKLDSNEKIGLLIRRNLKCKTRFDIDLEILHKKFKDNAFTAIQARNATERSRSTMNRILMEACKQNLVVKIGGGKRTLYAFKTHYLQSSEQIA